MLADLILALIERRVRVFVDYTDNAAKRRAYIRRSANIHADDPLDYQRRYLAGLAVLRSLRLTGQNRRDRKIVSLHRSKRA